MGFFVLRNLAGEAVIDVIRTPLWWYSGGLAMMAHWWVYMLRRGNAALGVLLWLKNLFVPMFGQHDWQGRLVSFLIRLVQLIARGIAFVVLVIFLTVALALWATGPLVLFLGLVLNFAG
ncbi:hypothetical protein A3H75_00395 [Candidatus Uhrbacteria bacterium RIFCSPLOWO2_02_FULL_51_9]|uniref:Uncharacterized protein n=1 Tax=Candidatus Uhrbacteria bacterium RIFCSPLOWO2_02_FULL_51_9 TaxID=1802410 RepID=A0A1F7VE66_9BACT|nr:MAG: hypothetical protein A3H75_00395 [Candidatus Uhrbacteria bacterium RIFCSPLOWO2_02_FULL_51_9]